MSSAVSISTAAASNQSASSSSSSSSSSSLSVSFPSSSLSSSTASVSFLISKEESLWLTYTRHHELLPFLDTLTPSVEGGITTTAALPASTQLNTSSTLNTSAVGATRTGKMTPYYLLLSKVSGFRIPPYVEAREKRTSLRFRVYLSLFDCTTRSFFGRTWQSKHCKMQDSKAGVTMSRQGLYYRSAVKDENCIGVVELVLLVVRANSDKQGDNKTAGSSSARSSDNEIIVERYGIGWTTINLFSRQASSLSDISDSGIDVMKASDDQRTLQEVSLDINLPRSDRFKRRSITRHLYAGSPRALLFVDFNDREWTKKLQRLQDCLLYYELFTCKNLKNYFHLFRENEFFCDYDVVGGLPLLDQPVGAGNNSAGSSTLDKTKKQRLGCFPADPRSLPYIHLPVYTINLKHPTIILPSGFEQRMIETLMQIRNKNWSSTGNEVVTILSRNLCVGVHNGRRYLRTACSLPLNPLSNNRSVGGGYRNRSISFGGDEDHAAQDSPITLEFEGEFKINDLACEIKNDDKMALIFELEYQLRWNIPGSYQFTQSSNILVGWAVKLLSSPNLLLNGTRQNLCLQRGPARTITNQRVYAYKDIDEEKQANTPLSIIWLNIALEAIANPAVAPNNQIVSDIKPAVQPINTKVLRPAASNSAETTIALSNENGGDTFNRQLDNIGTNVQPSTKKAPAEALIGIRPAQGITVGIQTGADLDYVDSVREHVGQSKLVPSLVSPPARGNAGTSMGHTNIQLWREYEDPLKTTEFILHFQSFSQPRYNTLHNPRVVQSLIFTCRFFNQLMFVSPRTPLLIPANSETMKKQAQQDNDDNLLSSAAEYQSNPFSCKYRVVIAPALHRLFVEYLYSKSLTLEVWDGDSFFCVGVAHIPLMQFLRQSLPSIERYALVEVHETPLLGALFENNSEKGWIRSAPGSNATNASVVRGKVSLSVINNGLGVKVEDEPTIDFIAAHTIPSLNSARLFGHSSSSMLPTSHHAASQHSTRSNSHKQPANPALRASSSSFRDSGAPGAGSGSGSEGSSLPSWMAASEVGIALNTSINRPLRVKAQLLTEREPTLVQSLKGLQGLSGLHETATDIRSLPINSSTPHLFSATTAPRLQSRAPTDSYAYDLEAPRLMHIFLRHYVFAFPYFHEYLPWLVSYAACC